MKIPTSITSWLFSSLAVFFIMTGCESHVDSRGNSPDPKIVISIQPGIHKRHDVEKRLGTPSTITAFDNEVWYYISGRVKSVAFFKPKLLKRRILTVKFDKNGIVQHQLVNHLPLGRNVDEAIRMVDALHHNQEHGEVCPANWEKGDEAMNETHESVADYLSKH